MYKAVLSISFCSFKPLKKTLYFFNAPSLTSFGDKLINIDKVTIFVENSRGGFISSTEPEDESIANMAEFKMRENENYDDAIKQKSEQLKEHIDSTFNKHGRVFLRQTDPLPLSILSIMPHGITTKGG